MVLTQSDIISSVREHLQKRGFTVTHSIDEFGLSVEFHAEKDRQKFLIEGVWETEPPDSRSIIYALGKIVKRMKERGFWIYYGIAIPKSYYMFLGQFEAKGFETLELHVLLVESFFVLEHLDPKMTVELIEGVKTGNISDLSLWSVNYGL
jgi:hypothetical protein